MSQIEHFHSAIALITHKLHYQSQRTDEYDAEYAKILMDSVAEDAETMNDIVVNCAAILSATIDLLGIVLRNPPAANLSMEEILQALASAVSLYQA